MNGFQESFWTYRYTIAPPLCDANVDAISQLLHEEQLVSLEAGAWSATLEFSPRKTDLVIVSVGPDQDRNINLRLERELRGMHVAFYLTRPVELGDRGK